MVAQRDWVLGHIAGSITGAVNYDEDDEKSIVTWWLGEGVIDHILDSFNTLRAFFATRLF